MLLVEYFSVRDFVRNTNLIHFICTYRILHLLGFNGFKMK